MSKAETNELEWYFRDLLFRNHNKGILQLEIESIPSKMVETYLRYRNEELWLYFFDIKNGTGKFSIVKTHRTSR